MHYTFQVVHSWHTGGTQVAHNPHKKQDPAGLQDSSIRGEK